MGVASPRIPPGCPAEWGSAKKWSRRGIADPCLAARNAGATALPADVLEKSGGGTQAPRQCRRRRLLGIAGVPARLAQHLLRLPTGQLLASGIEGAQPPLGIQHKYRERRLREPHLPLRLAARASGHKSPARNERWLHPPDAHDGQSPPGRGERRGWAIFRRSAVAGSDCMVFFPDRTTAPAKTEGKLASAASPAKRPRKLSVALVRNRPLFAGRQFLPASNN